MKKRSRQVGVYLIAFSVGNLLYAQNAPAQISPPDVVKLPAGLDLGSTSFYDGFGRVDPGWVFMAYGRANVSNSIKDSNGQSSSLFVNPSIDAISNVYQLIYVTPITLGAGSLGVNALLPVAGFRSHFDPGGGMLRDNGVDIGDLTFGPFYQSKPIMVGDRPFFSWRAELDFIAPIGGFDSTRDINQSSGFWSINPFVAVTALPLPKWEISARFYYIYNMETTRGANPPVNAGFAFQNGQAGQATWVNFASSYEIATGIRPGVNGYWLQQVTDDRTNGQNVIGSRVEELYLGPGLSWVIDEKNTLNFNVYLPVSVKNAPAGPQFNVYYIHPL